MAFLRGSGDTSPKTALPTYCQEKGAPKDNHSRPACTRQAQPDQQQKMAALRRMVLAISMFMLITLGMASAMNPRPWMRIGSCHGAKEAEREAIVDQTVDIGTGPESSTFSSLLGGASSDSLHTLLHKYFPESFQHGVWASEKQAMEAVHRVNAELATSIVKMAKRQGGNNSTTTTSTTSSQVPPTSSTTTTSQTSTTATSTSTTPPPTSTTSTTTGSTPTSTTPTSTTSTGTSSTSSTLPQSPSTSSTTSAQASASVQTSSSTASGGTTLTTAKTEASTTPTSSLVTTTFSSTDATGGVVVVTQTTFVNPAASSTTTRGGTLQTNAAMPQLRGGLVFEVLAGAVIGGVLLG